MCACVRAYVCKRKGGCVVYVLCMCASVCCVCVLVPPHARHTGVCVVYERVTVCVVCVCVCVLCRCR